ncbi:MAG: hypothetical protein BWY82_02831 [Verrucomicrobia bacterium ADurb.Bin474]|nr:MAG: hypothetical protein BWY82_02831 [Verrucomicrobia bacterium ADurb.Bin474]
MKHQNQKYENCRASDRGDPGFQMRCDPAKDENHSVRHDIDQIVGKGCRVDAQSEASDH